MKNIQTILLSIIPFFVYSQTHIIKLSNGIIVQGDIRNDRFYQNKNNRWTEMDF